MELEGYPSYLIYDDGRVYSKYINIFLKPSFHHGYLCCNLRENGKRKHFSIHRLVALVYIPNPDNLPEVDHIDGDHTNNHVSNLRWCSRSQNNQNTCVSKNNILGIKNISKYKWGYKFKKLYKGKLHQKYFTTLEEAISYKEEYYNKLNDEFCKMN
jgi:hypothetical protein